MAVCFGLSVEVLVQVADAFVELRPLSRMADRVTFELDFLATLQQHLVLIALKSPQPLWDVVVELDRMQRL